MKRRESYIATRAEDARQDGVNNNTLPHSPTPTQCINDESDSENIGEDTVCKELAWSKHFLYSTSCHEKGKMDNLPSTSHQDHRYAAPPTKKTKKPTPKCHVHCCVPECHSRGYVEDDEHGSRLYFSFPADPTIREQWIHAIRRDEDATFRVKSHVTKVCSLHFNPEDYEYSHYAKRNYVKTGRVPTIFKCWEKLGRSLDLMKKGRQGKKNKFRSCQLRLATISGVQNDESEKTEMMDRPNLTGADEDTTFTGGDTSVNEDTATQDQPSEQNTDSVEALRKELDEKLKIIETLNDKVRAINDEMNAEIKLSEFSVDNIKASDIAFFTGFPSIEVFNSVLTFLNPGLNGENIVANFEQPTVSQSSTSERDRPRELSPRDQFFLFMCRVWLGLLDLDLSYRFRISVSTVNTIIITWANFVYLRLGTLNIWPTKEQVVKTMPTTYLDKYPNTRVIIAACEMKMEMPSPLVLKSQSCSNYKSSNTLKKGLIGITPAGNLSFVSQLYTGNISDEELTIRSGLLKLPFDVGDDVIADKGFDIQDLLDPIGVKLNSPPFIGSHAQMSASDEASIHSIAAERIRVERHINKVKNFRIFDQVWPLTLAGTVNQIWTSCALLTLFQN